MALPNWILGVALLFWGVCLGVWPIAIPLAALVVAPRWVARRLDIGPTEFSRSLDVCWVLVFGGILLTYSREPVGSVLRSFAQWLPLVSFPALLVQVWSETGRIPMGALLPLPWWRRRQHGVSTADMSGPFFVFCLLSGSVSGGGRAWFYLGLMAVAGIAFWTSRARGWRAWTAATFLGLVMAGGWFVGLGLGGLQGWFENRVLTWVMQWRRDDAAFRSAKTSIGSTGDVGGSGRVVLTVQGEAEGRVPPRLRIAAFTAWGNGTWYAPSAPFEKIDGAAGEWTLDARRGLAGSARVELRHEVTSGLLPLPGGVRTIGDCPADTLERTPMGAVRATVAMGMLPYRIDYAADADWEMQPTDDDVRDLRPAEKPAIDAVAGELGLAGLGAREVVDRVGNHFEAHFRYTTMLKPGTATDPRATTPLGRFLLSDREGHCEYFATAGVLLLRAAGVPARYVTGFLVSPTDKVNGLHYVRERHAHAWVRVWLDGHWEDFDPTPSALFGEVPVVGWWDRVMGGLGFSLSRWWWLGEKRWLRESYWLALPLLALMLWRFRRLRAARTDSGRDEAGRPGPGWPGADSEWFDVERELAVKGWSRGRREGRTEWVRRLGDSSGEKVPSRLGERVAAIHGLHERLRFDPEGLPGRERTELRELSRGLSVELGEAGLAGAGGAAVTPAEGATRA